MSADLIPARIISASKCISKFFPGSWAIRWSSDDQEERERSAAAFQIHPSEIDRTLDWATDSFQELFGWPNTFYSLESAKTARAEFLSPDADIAVIGLGLHRDDAEEFLGYAKPPEHQQGYAPQGETGIYECVKALHLIGPGGRRIGYELLATYVGILTDSWLCNGLEKEFAEKLGVKPNEHGLIAEYPDARRCTEYISHDHVGAEGDLWKPWLVTLYSA